MTDGEVATEGASGDWRTGSIDWKLEVVIIPVSDVDRAKEFYANLGWRLDADFVLSEALRIVQFTPPGSGCSIGFGTGVTSAPPGSAEGLELIVGDVVVAREEIAGRGVDVSEVFHGSPFSEAGRISGPDPERQSYRSYAAFADPDGNKWLLQEVTTRLPGRIDPTATSFGSAAELANAMRRAAMAHGEHEQRHGGEYDTNWPDWYASYMVAEQAGTELPE
jgi:catechol 2,3-dioxygenase-like lactoylglutathione lyase family enzyme